MMIDTHLHLNSLEFDQDLSVVIHNAHLAGVNIMVINGYDLPSSEKAIRISEQYPGVYATCGVHPSEAVNGQLNEASLETMLQHPNVIGVGEIGLDYYWDDTTKTLQQALFHKQLALAVKYGLPVIVHSRSAIQDTYDILSTYPVRGIMHCYSSSYEMALRFIKRGFLLGIGGVLTFKNAGLREVVQQIDLTSIVTETDSPYLAPEPYRGKRNEPKFIPIIIKTLSQLKNQTEEDVVKIVYQNFTSLFQIKEAL
ncbi:MAG: TatD family hydrolase [Bacilli bacterium]